MEPTLTIKKDQLQGISPERFSISSTFRALKNKNFAALLFGQTLSRIGDFLFQIAMVWWVLEKTGSAAAMGGVLFFSILPTVIFSLIAGVVVDRMRRGLVLFYSDMARCIIMVIGTWLAFTGRLVIWQIYVIAILFGVADAFFMPAYSAIIQQIVPLKDLPSANSVNSLSMQFGRVAGPALGGLTAWLGGTSFAFGANAFSFLIGALTVLPILFIPRPAPQEEEFSLKQFFADLRGGFETIFGSPILWITILVFSLTNITLAGPYNIAMPFLVQDKLGGDEKMLGLIYSIFPIGYAIASIIMGSFPRIRHRGIIFYVASIIAGLGLGAFGLNVPFPALVVAALLNGAALEINSLIWMNLLQEYVPPVKMGRVSSVDMLGSFVLLPIGFAITGWLVDSVGASIVFLISGVISALICLLPLLHPAIRKTN